MPGLIITDCLDVDNAVAKVNEYLGLKDSKTRGGAPVSVEVMMDRDKFGECEGQ